MIPTTKTAPLWVSGKELRSALRIGHNVELRLRREGVLRPGIHFRRKGSSASSPIVYDLGACDQALRDKAASDARRFEDYSAG